MIINCFSASTHRNTIFVLTTHRNFSILHNIPDKLSLFIKINKDIITDAGSIVGVNVQNTIIKWIG